MQGALREWIVKNVTDGNKNSIIPLSTAKIKDLIVVPKINLIVLLHLKALDRKTSHRMFMIKRNPRFY